jgi:hypothetical protein
VGVLEELDCGVVGVGEESRRNCSLSAADFEIFADEVGDGKYCGIFVGSVMYDEVGDIGENTSLTGERLRVPTCSQPETKV